VRTTLTLDEDVARLVEREMKRLGVSKKEAVNRMIRIGWTAGRRTSNAKRYVVKPRKMGLLPGMSYDSISELLEQVEGPYHR
jgi:hypothetical protein